MSFIALPLETDFFSQNIIFLQHICNCPLFVNCFYGFPKVPVSGGLAVDLAERFRLKIVI